MKSLRCFLILMMLLPQLANAAEPKPVAAVSRITAVTVYADRALTTRSASLDLRPGSYLVLFDSLPALIQDDSVRVTGKGSAGVTIAGMEVKKAFLEQSGEQRVKELDREIRALEGRLGGLEANKAGLIAQKAFLESIRVAWGERISKELAVGRPTVADLREAISLIGSGVTKVEEQVFDIDKDQRSIREKIEALQRQRNEAAGSWRKESKSVEVLLEVAREGVLTLELSSIIPQAGWVPSYDVRLAPDAKSAELTFRAMVRQQTGEDWNGVNLTLSTARPASGGAPPELNPWHISFFRPQPPPMPAPVALAREMKSMRAGRMYDTAMPEAAIAEAPAAYETAQVSAEQSSFSFHIPRPLDIPSDGTQHGSVVAVEQLPVSMEFLAVPKLSPFVFLKSEIVNKAGYPLLAGKVNTFSANTYTGSSQLKKVASGEKFELFFGSDDQVTIKREELKQQKEAGLFGRNSVSYRYRIELNNFRKEPVTLTLRDQLPLAGDEEIKVTLEEPSIKPDEFGSEGRLTWKMPLKAGEKKELTFGILVEYPKDREITGL
jgi:uncharacterized protein (TIGR02231 family)